MTIIVDGKLLSDEKLNSLKKKVNKLTSKPKLAIVQVGNNNGSNIYVKNIVNKCNQVNFDCICHKLDEHINQSEVETVIKNLNKDNSITAIQIQQPLPKHLNSNKILNTIDSNKDVECLTTVNLGKLFLDDINIFPCTAKSVVEILKEYKVNLKGKNIVVIGRSNIVGKPLIHLLLKENATVTVLHSHSKDIEEYTKKADIVIVAVGKANFLTKHMIKKDSIVIDVGINRVNGETVGDVDFDNVKDKTYLITPVPNGVGSVTSSILLEQVYELAKI